MAKQLSEDTKFTLDVKTIIGAAIGVATLVGFYYMMMGEIQEAKELPVPQSLYLEEYPSKPEGYNWSPSYEQYKQQVGNLQDDVDEIYEIMDMYKDDIKELKKQVVDLRIGMK